MKLNVNEEKLRDVHLRKLALGEIQGPMVGNASIDKPWLKYYSEEAVMTDIPNTKIYNYMYDCNKNNLDANALNFLGKKIKYKTLFEEVEKTAKALKKLGVKKGDVVVIAMANTPETVYTFYALNRIGAVVNAVDPRLKGADLKKYFNEANSEYCIALDMSCDQINEILDETTIKKVVNVSPIQSLPKTVRKVMALSSKKKEKNMELDGNKYISWESFIKDGYNYKGIIDSEYKKDVPAVMVHTGGTTGFPKGVVLSNDDFNAMAIMHNISGYEFEKGDKFLNILPPFIAYCLCNAIQMPLCLGVEVTMVPMFTPSDFPNLIDKYKPNHVLGGPILWEYAMNSKKLAKKDLSFLKSPVSGGDTMNSELEMKVNDFLKAHNCKHKVAQGYGMTELSSAAVYSKESANKLGSVGIPFVKNNVSIFDIETGEELKYGETGEICINSPTVMLGYYNKPNETDELIKKHDDSKKWVHTGDIGYIDNDGSVFIMGRMKRVITRSGNKVYPSSLETIIMSHPAVETVAVVGMYNESEREVPIAHIILKPEFENMESKIVNQIDDIIKQNLPDFYVPMVYKFRKDLPLTSINKIDFKSLEQEYDIADKVERINNRIVFENQIENNKILTKKG